MIELLAMTDEPPARARRAPTAPMPEPSGPAEPSRPQGPTVLHRLAPDATTVVDVPAPASPSPDDVIVLEYLDEFGRAWRRLADRAPAKLPLREWAQRDPARPRSLLTVPRRRSEPPQAGRPAP